MMNTALRQICFENFLLENSGKGFRELFATGKDRFRLPFELVKESIAKMR